MPLTKNDVNQLVDFLHFFKAREKVGVYYQNISIIGLVSFLITYFDLKNSLIPVNILIWIGGISSVLITLIFIKFYKRELGIVWSLFHNLTIGLIVVFLFIKSNDLLSRDELKTDNYYIQKLELKKEKARRGGSYLVPIITVKINGIDRRLKLSSYYLKDAQKTRRVRIDMKNGFWNYPIIKNIQLIENE